jgi:hypothetical protein
LLDNDIGMAAVEAVEVGRGRANGTENRDNCCQAKRAKPESVHRHAFLMSMLARNDDTAYRCAGEKSNMLT